MKISALLRFFIAFLLSATSIFISPHSYCGQVPPSQLNTSDTDSVARQDTLNRFYQHLMQSIRYPAIAREEGMMGTVVVSFDFLHDGQTGNFAVVKSVGGGCNQSVIGALKSFKDKNHIIKPGRYNLPVTFVLGDNTPVEPIDAETKALPNLLKQIVVTGVYQ